MKNRPIITLFQVSQLFSDSVCCCIGLDLLYQLRSYTEIDVYMYTEADRLLIADTVPAVDRFG